MGEFTYLNPSFGQNRLSQVTDITLSKDMVNILSSKSELPKPGLAIFSGDLLEFPQLVSNLGDLYRGKSRRFCRESFLGHHTSEEAKDAIRVLLRIPKEKAYLETKSVDRFGNKFIMVNAFRKKMSEWPVFQIKMVIHCRNCYTSYRIP